MRAGDLVRFKYTGAKDEDWKAVHASRGGPNFLFADSVVLRAMAGTFEPLRGGTRRDLASEVGALLP